MGGLLHLFDFHNNSFSRKVFSHHHKSRDEDLEAPRNSFELQVDNFHTYHNDKDKPSYGFEEEEWYERSCYPIEESMKKKIIEELSKRSNDKQNSPSLVAKLMGMEALPLESVKSSSVWINPRRSKVDQFDNEKGGGGRRSRKGKLSSSVIALDVMETPMRREHPQEEELQRFRREFEAWQADKRFKDCSRIVESGCVAQEEKERLFTRTRSFGRDFNLKSDRTAPTRIVVLRPGLQRAYDYEDSLTTSSGTTIEGSRGSSIEEFLEEVKERLKGELQGRAALKRSSSVRGSGIETPFSERPSPRSELMRSYAASEVQCNAPDSPTEFISRDTRKLLADRLKNVLRKEMSPLDDSAVKCSSRLRPTVSDAASLRKQTEEINQEDTIENRDVSKKDSSSPRNLKRSLSAPVSGTSFGKLLLEDRHVLTGAQIMRKHEAAITEREETDSETEPVVMDPIRRKERFNLRKKVSNFRSTLRGRIFGKKIRSMIESNSFEDESIKDFVTGSRFNNFYDRNENSTEVPPSPASVCSSTPEEFWRNVDYLSQVSTPDVTVSDENGMPQVFRDISSNLSELRRQINELESDVQVPTPVEEEASREIETIVDLGNPDKVFVRDLLVASGLYDGTSDISLTRWDPFAKPIKRSVLEETKEDFKKRSNQNEDDTGESTRSEADHNILFDLLNEVLTVVLGPLTRSGFKKKLMSSSVSESTAIRGKYLLESAWRMMSEYLYSQPERPFCSLDGIIGWDMEKSPWSGLIGEEVDVLGKEVEGMIMVDLVEELVKDLRRQIS